MTLLLLLWRNDAISAHHLLLETETTRKTGPANSVETVLTKTMSDTHEMTTASGTPRPVRTISRNSMTARAARQATTDNKDTTPSEWTTACTAGRETVNPTRDKAGIHEMHGDQEGKKALSSCDLTQHPQNNALV